MILSEPVTLHGEGKFNLNVVKYIQVTDAFLGMDKDKKECQNEEYLDSCLTRLHMDAIIRECKCVPFSIGKPMKVSQNIHYRFISYIFIVQ